MELNETIGKMNSADYKERMVAEYYQTKIRYEKLKKFCNKIEAAMMTGNQQPAHDCPFDLLRDQKRVMEQYLHILELRAEIEGVNL